MDKFAVTQEPTTIYAPSGSDELTPELAKLVEDAQVPCYPGCKVTVFKFIYDMMDIQMQDPNVTNESIKEMIILFADYVPNCGKLLEFADKLDDLECAYLIMKSNEGNAESSTKIPNATKGKEISKDSRDGAPEVQQNSQPTLLFPQRSKLIFTTPTGEAKRRRASPASTTPK